MIGRKKELTELNRIYNSTRAQLVAVYGRRRIGKTYLVDETFKGKITFRHAGLSPVEVEKGASTSPLKAQLEDDVEGAQVDLIIDRKDNIVNMCEIKFYGNEFSVSKDYHKTLINRQELLSKELSPKVIIHNTLITTYGLKYNEYSSDFDSVVMLDDLFL